MPGHDIDLVAKKGERRSDATLELALNWSEVSDYISRVNGRKRQQFRQVLPMIRQTDRHDREGCDARMKLQKIFDGSIKMISVIETRAQHDLTVQLDSGASEPGNLLHQTVIF